MRRWLWVLLLAPCPAYCIQIGGGPVSSGGGNISVTIYQNLIPGDSNYIQVSSVPQVNSTFNVGSGTVLNLNAINMSKPGKINISTNPVDWSELKGVPAGFADGTDDGGVGGSGDFNSFQNPSTGPLDMNQFAVHGGSEVAIGNLRLSVFTSTSDARGNTFINFSSTFNSKWELHKATADVQDSNFNTWFSTYSSRNASILTSTQAIDGIQLKIATFTVVGINGGTPLGGAQVTAIDCQGSATCTQSGGTLTVTASGGGTVLGFRSIFSTNAVVTTNQSDSPHAFIISTGSLQGGSTIYVSSGTIPQFNSDQSTITKVILGAGVVGAPSLVFTGSNQTGFYSAGADIFAFSNLGAQTFSLSSILIMQSGKQLQADIGSISAPGLAFRTGATAGLYAQGGPINVYKFSSGTNERIGWWTTGQTSYGSFGSGGAGTLTLPPAMHYFSTTSASNIAILAVGTGTTASPTKLFEIMGASSTFMNVFSSSWTNVQTVTITEATFTVKNSLNADRFRMSPSSAFINMPVFINSTMSASNISVSNNSIFYSTQTPAFLAGYVMAVGSFTALATGGTLVVSPPAGFTNVYFPQVSEFATDAESNQVNISILTETGFTIKNKSALNTKSGVWSCFLK